MFAFRHVLHDRRTGRRSDSGFAMMTSLFLVTAVGGLAVALTGIMLSQTRPMLLLTRNVSTVHAAEAGLDSGISLIRRAAVGSVGDSSQLPCGPSFSAPVMKGSVSSGGPTYAVAIRYYTLDPKGQTETWRTSKALNCTAGSGTTTVPRYALIESLATATGRTETGQSRRLESVYDMHTSNANVLGGVVELRGTGLCLAGVGGVGSAVTIATCDRTSPAQLWAFRDDLSWVLLSTAQSGSPLCLDAANGVAGTVLLAVCNSSTYPRQTFIPDQFQEIQGANSAGNLNSWCMRLSSQPPAAGTPLVMGACVRSVTPTTISTWTPAAEVGAGAAGSQDGLPAANGQLVSYLQFGRCMDVTGEVFTKDHMIVFTCHQRPDPTKIPWNQKIAAVPQPNGTVQLQSTKGSETRCWTLGYGTVPVYSGIRILTRPCEAGLKQQEWSFPGNTSTYAENYTVRSNGLCLSIGAPVNAEPWSILIAEACDGSKDQKWNAPPNLVPSRVHDTRERVVG